MKGMLLFCALALLLVPCLTQADVAEIMSYQGVLRDGSGSPVPDGSYGVTFRIYDVETGGTALWTEVQTLTATGGIINAHLGSVTTLSTLDFEVPYWLGISVEGGAELVPRTAFTTVPYAVHAVFADQCTEGDDWENSGDDIYRGSGNVGVGLPPVDARLDVVAGDGIAGDFSNGSLPEPTVRAYNAGGTAGAFFSMTDPYAVSDPPAAVYGRGAVFARGGHFYASSSEGLYVETTGPNTALLAQAHGTGYAAQFLGDAGIQVQYRADVGSFRMLGGSSPGYVLTSDSDGAGTWQPAAAVSDGDWTIAANDIFSTVSGRVGIGLTLPTAKLEVYNVTTEEALEVKHGGATAGRVVNIERVSMPASGNDLLQLRIPAGSPSDCQFIECERGSTPEFVIDGDGYIDSNAGAEFGGPVSVTGTDRHQVEVKSSALMSLTKVLSGISTAVGAGYDPIGVYGESIPAVNFGIGGSFTGGYRGVEGSAIPGETGDYRGVYGHVSGGNGTNHGVYGSASGGAINYGIYGFAFIGTDYAGYFNGDAHVTGTFTAGVKSFKIDHPLDPENKYLLHSCVESDDMMNIYNGNVMLDARGEAWVEMPEWFEALNQDFRYQLTAIGAPGPNLYVAEKISGNRFRIAGGEPGSEVSWQVTGVRHDPLAVASRMTVELDKPASEVGKYMHPEAYGMPLTAGVDYHEERESAVSSGPTERGPREAFDPNDGE